MHVHIDNGSAITDTTTISQSVHAKLKIVCSTLHKHSSSTHHTSHAHVLLDEPPQRNRDRRRQAASESVSRELWVHRQQLMCGAGC
jgi:hypothetical protein